MYLYVNTYTYILSIYIYIYLYRCSTDQHLLGVLCLNVGGCRKCVDIHILCVYRSMSIMTRTLLVPCQHMPGCRAEPSRALPPYGIHLLSPNKLICIICTPIFTHFTQKNKIKGIIWHKVSQEQTNLFSGSQPILNHFKVAKVIFKRCARIFNISLTKWNYLNWHHFL